MKKNVIQVITCLTVILCSIMAHAALPEANPPDFRGIRWGTNINSLSGFTLVHNWGISKVYERAGDRLSLGNVPLEIVLYEFYMDQFFSASLAGTRQPEEVERLLRVTYGEPYVNFTQSQLVHIWSLENVRISYSRDFSDGFYSILINYMPIARIYNEQIEQAEREGILRDL